MREEEQKTNLSGGIYNLHREMVHSEFHDPFIIRGYRKPNLSALECLKSAFVFSCNESFNIMSHFGAFVYLAIKYYGIFTDSMPFTDPVHWPLMCQAIGILGFCFMSCTAHTFNSMSNHARHRCFFLDYAAISIYCVGAGLAFFYYQRPLISHSSGGLTPTLFILVSVVTSLISTYMCCLSRNKWTSIKYVIRTSSYILAFLVNSFPCYYRLVTCDNPTDCDKTNFGIYTQHAFYLFLAALANVTKFPERLMPGKFDALGQSHHIMHVLFPVACHIKFQYLCLEIEQKRSLLVTNEVVPSFHNTIVPMFLAVFLNTSIALLSSTGKKHIKEQ